MKPRNILLLKIHKKLTCGGSFKSILWGGCSERGNGFQGKVLEERGLLPRLGQSPLCWFIGMLISAPLSLGSHSLSLDGKPSLFILCLRWLPPAALLAAENLRRFYFSELPGLGPLFLCFDRFLNLIFIFSRLHSSSGVRPPDYGFFVKIRNPADGHKNPRVFAFDIHFGGNGDWNLTEKLFRGLLIFP